MLNVFIVYRTYFNKRPPALIQFLFKEERAFFKLRGVITMEFQNLVIFNYQIINKVIYSKTAGNFNCLVICIFLFFFFFFSYSF